MTITTRKMKTKAYFRKKLFFNSWIRLMIQSNLKITHNSIFFLALTGSFETTQDKFNTALMMALLGIFVVWPIFLTVFLLYNRGELRKKEFKKKFESMYLGIKTDVYRGEKVSISKARCFLFNVVFCIRRLSIVLCFYFLRDRHDDSVLYGILAI